MPASPSSSKRKRVSPLRLISSATQPSPRFVSELEREPLAALDTYELRHLALHLAASGRVDELHRLLALQSAEPHKPPPRSSRLSCLLRRRPPSAPAIVHNAWYVAKEKIGEIDGFVADLNRAEGLAAGTAGAELKNGGMPDVGLEVRYAVERSSVSSLASGLPWQLLGELANRGGWSFEEARAYARQVPSAERRAQSLSVLLSAAPAGERDGLAWEALETLSEINKDEGRIGLYPGEHTRRIVLEHLVPLLSREQLYAVSDQVAKFRDKEEVLYVQEALLPALARLGDTDMALERCLAMTGEVVQARTLDHFADLLDETKLDRVLAAVNAEGEGETADLATVAVPRLAAFGRGLEALSQIETLARLPYPGPMMSALRALPAGIDADTLESALNLAKSIGEPQNRAAVLVGMLARSAIGRRDVLIEALGAMDAIDWDYSRSQELIKLAPQLTDSQVPAAAAVASRIRDTADRVGALAALGRGRPEAVRAQLRGFLHAMRTARYIKNGIAVFEPERVLAALEREKFPEAAIADIVGDLPDELLSRALAIARRIGDERAQEEVHARIGAQRLLLSVRNLNDLGSVADDHLRGELIARIAQLLPDDKIGTALELAIALEDTNAKAIALEALVSRLSIDQLERALDGFGTSFSSGHGWHWLGGLLAPRLPESLLDKALALASQQRDEAMRGWALASLIPFLSGARLKQAVACARNLVGDDTYQRDAALAAAVQRFVYLGDLNRAIASAGAITEPAFQADAVVALADASTPERWDELLVLARQVATDQEHPRSLFYYRDKAILALALHSPNDQREALIAEAFPDDEESLAVVAGMLPSEQLDLVLQRLPTIENERLRLPPLVAAAPRLNGTLLERGIAIARAFSEPEFASKALFAFVPMTRGPVRAELLQLSLDAACRETSDISRHELFGMLIAALGELDAIDVHGAWRTALSAVARRERAEVLETVSILAPLIARLGGQASLEKAEAGIDDAVRWWP